MGVHGSGPDGLRGGNVFERKDVSVLRDRLREPRRFMQILLGPRQVGKTTAVRQALAGVGLPHHYASARDVAGGAHGWTASVWETARFRMKAAGCPSFVLVLDDVEQVPDWTEAVKGEWDADTRNRVDIRVLIAGSSRAFLMKGLTESLMGRFEEIRMPHWNFPEMEAASGLSLDEYVWFGGLPVGMAFRHDDARRRACVESAAESSLLLDVLRDDDVQKPPLLREAFRLGAAASGEELSLTKLMARLSDAGNTTTLTAYFAKCREAGLLAALGKFSGEQPRRRAARPRFQVFDNGVLSALCAKSFRAVREDPAAWGRHVVSAVGAHLLSEGWRRRWDVTYWREGDAAVDFVFSRGGALTAVAVERPGEGFGRAAAGLSAFRERFGSCRTLAVGPSGIPLVEFLRADPAALLS